MNGCIKDPTLRYAFENRIQLINARKKKFHKDKIHKTIEDARQKISKYLQCINENLSHHTWAAGHHYSQADIIATSLLTHLYFLNETALFNDMPAFDEYWQRVQNRPNFQKADMWVKTSLLKKFEMAVKYAVY